MDSFNSAPFFQFLDRNNDQDDVHLRDSRYKFHESSPVNPTTEKSVVYGTSIPSGEMYYPFDESKDFKWDSLNQLNYSGGSTQLLRVPLQMNFPNSDEMLRSQDILITPYNRIKYSNNIC